MRIRVFHSMFLKKNGQQQFFLKLSSTLENKVIFLFFSVLTNGSLCILCLAQLLPNRPSANVTKSQISSQI
jgi:hypothetical protein